MTEQERAAELADEIENSRVNLYTDPRLEMSHLRRGDRELTVKALRLLAATPAASTEVRERVAREIYAAFPFDEATGSKPAWVEGGNSIRQDDARRCATRILDIVLSAIRPGYRLPAGVVAPGEPTEAMVVAGDSAVVPILASLGCRTRAEMAAKRIGPIYRAMIAAIAAPKETGR